LIDWYEVRMWLLDRVPIWFRMRWPMVRFYWTQQQCDDIKESAKDLYETFVGPPPALAQKLYDTRRNLRESITFYPLTVAQEETDDWPEYHRVFTTVEEFDEVLERWERLEIILPEVTPKQTVDALQKVVKF
jgi:hypothetical protein